MLFPIQIIDTEGVCSNNGGTFLFHAHHDDLKENADSKTK